MSINAGVSSYNEAAFDGSHTIKVGQTPGGASLAEIDVLGHEFSHGVIKSTSNLNSYCESGALGESFADIFGLMIQNYGTGILNWTIGEDVGYGERSLSDPTSINQSLFQATCGGTLQGQPAIYHGQNWYYGSCDHSGSHINDGVQNKWFYLLVRGGTFNNVTVGGIGIDKAACIAYKNVTQYLGSSSVYSDARAGSVLAASSLYGACSYELAQVKNAWAAVGVGSPAPPNATLCIYPGDFVTQLCKHDFNCYNSGAVQAIYTVNTSLSGASFVWSIPASWIATTSGNTATIYYFGDMLPASISVTATLGSQTATYGHTVGWNPHCQIYGWPCTLYRLKGHNASVNSTGNPDLKFSPNPANNSFSAEFTESEIGNVLEIQNNLGQTLMEFRANGKEQSFDVSILSSGVYFVILKSKESFKVGRLILNK